MSKILIVTLYGAPLYDSNWQVINMQQNMKE